MVQIPAASIIIPVKNEGENLKSTLFSLQSARVNTSCEIILVDDNSQDGCCEFLKNNTPPEVRLYRTAGLGAAAARTFGARQAQGKVLVFCDAHITVPDGWLDILVETASRPGVGGVSPIIAPTFDPAANLCGWTWNEKLETMWLSTFSAGPTPVPLLPGGCMAVGQEPFFSVGGFDYGLRVWGREDEELSLKLRLFGYELLIEPRTKILHLFRQSHPYTVRWEHVHYNLLRMAFLHFSPVRIAKVIGMLKNFAHAEHILTDVIFQDTLLMREYYAKKRVHDDSWFMERFAIPF